jgi:hypothetical protein
MVDEYCNICQEHGALVPATVTSSPSNHQSDLDGASNFEDLEPRRLRLPTTSER